jgi:hypothetical protein
MPAKKMRVELFDSEGNRYTIAFEGQVTREKAVRLLDLVELLGGVSNDGRAGKPNDALELEKPSKFDKVRMAVRRNFPLVWFSSKELQSTYEQEFKEPLNLSTAATYLSRLADQGAIVRAGPSNSLRYRVVARSPAAAEPRQQQ